MRVAMMRRLSTRARACLVVVLLTVTAGGTWVVASYRERETYYDDCGVRVSVWDAMWVELRPSDPVVWQSCVGIDHPDKLPGPVEMMIRGEIASSHAQARLDAEAAMIRRMNLAASGLTPATPTRAASQ